MRIHVGTSGFQYKEWRGSFYPEGLPEAQMLRQYATKLPTVEINNTFYRMPKPELLEKWASEVPDGFLFVLKASQRITHRARIKDARELVRYLYETAAAMGPKLGPVLFQLPPNLKKDLPRLQAFLETLPDGARAAIEFRHGSWYDEDVYGALEARGVALVAAETDEEPAHLHATSRYGYLRLRRTSYAEGDIDAWLARIRGQAWDEAFVFFKHEDAGTGPRLAADLLARAAEPRQ